MASVELLVSNRWFLTINNACCLAIGYRSLTEMPPLRRPGRVVLDSVTGAGNRVTDSQSGLRALNRKAVEQLAKTLKMDGFAIESEMIYADGFPNGFLGYHILSSIYFHYLNYYLC